MPLWLTAVIALITGLIDKWVARSDSHEHEARDQANQREIGSLKAERDQALEGLEAASHMAEEAAKPLSEDDALARIEKGEG